MLLMRLTSTKLGDTQCVVFLEKFPICRAHCIVKERIGCVILQAPKLQIAERRFPVDFLHIEVCALVIICLSFCVCHAVKCDVVWTWHKTEEEEDKMYISRFIGLVSILGGRLLEYVESKDWNENYGVVSLRDVVDVQRNIMEYYDNGDRCMLTWDAGVP